MLPPAGTDLDGGGRARAAKLPMGTGSLGRNVNMSLNLNVGIHLNMWVFDGTLDTKEPCLKLRKPSFRGLDFLDVSRNIWVYVT